ncbi:MAG: histidine kinase, partial [Coriobacteriales bacterium]
MRPERKRRRTSDIGSYYRILTIIMAFLMLGFLVATVFGFVLEMFPLQVAGIVGLCISAIFFGRYSKSPDKLTADQTNSMLGLAEQTLNLMQGGLNKDSATEVCNILIDATDAKSVAIYDGNEDVVGHAGCDSIWDEMGDPIPIPWALNRFEYGAKFVIRSEHTDDEKMPTELKACIGVPMKIQDEIVGSLKMYYSKHDRIDETQQATATGFAMLLSTQLALSELDAKTELATKMELRALQAQINPHFLFNTINTIASLIRTDPRQARILLREFAIFYRRTLESSQDLITIELELEQTLRYLGFERARFGAEKILLTSDVEPGLDQLQVPAFIVQPIVENAVGHAMRPTGEPLHIAIEVKRAGDDVVISVADDGVGMESTQRDKAVEKGNSKGAGIALKNVDDRLKSCFGKGSGIHIESVLDEGTT